MLLCELAPACAIRRVSIPPFFFLLQQLHIVAVGSLQNKQADQAEVSQMNKMSRLPLGECGRQLTTGAAETAQLSRRENLHGGAASSLCAATRPPVCLHGAHGYVCL